MNGFLYKAMYELQNSTVCNYMTDSMSINKFKLFLDALPQEQNWYRLFSNCIHEKHVILAIVLFCFAAAPNVFKECFTS